MDERQRPVNPYGAPQDPQQYGRPAPQGGNRQMPQAFPPAAGYPVPQGYNQPAPQAYPQGYNQAAPRAYAQPYPQPVAAPARPGGSTAGTVLLWFGVVVGVALLMSSVSDLTDSVAYGIGGILLGIAVTGACAWPLLCRRKDRTAFTAWEKEQATNRELASYLTEEDAAIARSLAPTAPPAPTPRRWKQVGLSLAAVGVLGSLLLSAGSDEYEKANPESGVSQSGS